MPLHVIGDRNRGSGLLVLFLASVAIFSMPLPVGIVISASVVQGGLVSRLPSRAFFALGLLLAMAGMFLLTRIDVGTHYYTWTLAGLTLVGLGIGPPTVVALDMSSTGVAPEDVGVAGSLANVVQQIGPAIGIAVLSSVAATATAHYATGHAGTADPHATGHGFTVAFWYGAAIFAAAAVICTALVRPGTRTGATSDPMELEALASLEAV